MKRYFKHKINNLIVVNKIVTIHYFEFSKDFKSHTESHNFWELVFCDKQAILCQSDDKQTQISQGEIFLHKPNAKHKHYSNGVNAPNVFIISFECHSEGMNFLANQKIKPDKKTLHLIYSIWEEAKRSFNIPYSDPKTKKMELLSAPALGGIQLIKNYLEILLIELLRKKNNAKTNDNSFIFERELSDKMVEDVIKILEQNVYSSITIDQICNRLSYSKAYIFRKFKNQTGKTVIKYFIWLKIERAKQLIREGLSVKEISIKLNFDTPNYFSKTFKKVTGITPSTYKSRLAK